MEKRRTKKQEIYRKLIKNAHVNPTISIITLSVNGLVTSIKRQRLLDWNKKHNFPRHYLHICTSYSKTQIG